MITPVSVREWLDEDIKTRGSIKFSRTNLGTQSNHVVWIAWIEVQSDEYDYHNHSQHYYNSRIASLSMLLFRLGSNNQCLSAALHQSSANLWMSFHPHSSTIHSSPPPLSPSDSSSDFPAKEIHNHFNPSCLWLCLFFVCDVVIKFRFQQED